MDRSCSREESLSSLSLELQKAQELSHTRLSKVSVDLTEQKEDLRRFIAEGLRKIEQKLVEKTSGSRVLGLVMEELEGVVRTVAQRELQSFQREAQDVNSSSIIYISRDISLIYLSIYPSIHPSIHLSLYLCLYISIFSIYYRSIMIYMYRSTFGANRGVHPLVNTQFYDLSHIQIGC